MRDLIFIIKIHTLQFQNSNVLQVKLRIIGRIIWVVKISTFTHKLWRSGLLRKPVYDFSNVCTFNNSAHVTEAKLGHHQSICRYTYSLYLFFISHIYVFLFLGTYSVRKIANRQWTFWNFKTYTRYFCTERENFSQHCIAK